MVEERNRLRKGFDADALLYDEVRPGYPEALFEDVVELSGIAPGGRILEIGCGTGQATAPFARRGYAILCVELGENLAAAARRNLAAYPQAEVLTADFEGWTPPRGPSTWWSRRRPFTGWIPLLHTRRSPSRSGPAGPSPCSGTSTFTAMRAGASSRPRRKSTSARRRRSSSQKTVEGFLGLTRSRTGPARSSLPACWARFPSVVTSGTNRTTPRATCAS